MQGEQQLKVAVIERLFQSGQIDDDAVVATEVTVCDWKRRADIVVSNGKLACFEIKSELDSLTRLSGQLADYLTVFERTTVVCAKRFEDEIKRSLPSGVGLWVADRDPVRLTEKVRARALKPSKHSLLSVLNVSDLRDLIKANGMQLRKSDTRIVLEEMVLTLPHSDILQAAREAVKKRYRTSHRTFLETRKKHGTSVALSSKVRQSSKPTAVAKPSAEASPHSWSLPAVSNDAHHELIVDAPAGLVIKRRRSKV